MKRMVPALMTLAMLWPCLANADGRAGVPSPDTFPLPTRATPTTYQGTGVRHGLGLSAGMAPGSGFSYRHYLDPMTALRVTGMLITTDGGDKANHWIGLSGVRYLKIWHRRRAQGLLPDTSALRLVAGGSYLYQRHPKVSEVPNDLPNCEDKPTPKNECQTKKVQVNQITNTIATGAGIGFEFGGVDRPGFSLSLDVMLTAQMDDSGGKLKLRQLWPIPSAALMWNW